MPEIGLNYHKIWEIQEGKTSNKRKRKNPQNLAVLRIFLGGDYWTRTSDLLRVKIRRDVKALLLDAFRHFWPRFLWVQITVLSTVSTR